MTGIVNNRGHAIVCVTFRHPQAAYRLDLEAMVDTGCEVDAVLTSLEIAALGLPYWRTHVIQLANGVSHPTRVYSGVIEWFGTLRLIDVYESGGGLSLLGARLLTPHTLVVDYTAREP